MKTMKSWRTVLVATLLLTVMLSVTGGTIAWFTDTVSSAGNTIEAGTLDVALYSKVEDGYEEITDGSDPIYNYNNWEPGYTDLKYFKIENKGSLAFKFNLNLVPTATVQAGDVNLADVIEVYAGTNNPPTSAADLHAMEAKGVISELAVDEDGMAYGVLLPKSGAGSMNASVPDGVSYPEGEIEMWVALHMKEEAGNEYQGKSVGKGFAIKLLATQFTYENDSFGNQYDEDSETVSSGTAGNISYNLNVDGTLAISGTGVITKADIESLTSAYASQITNVKIGSGITEIGEEAFRGLNISAVTFEDESQLKVIGVNAFRDCKAMKTFYVPASVEKICEKAFQGCASLETVTFEANSNLTAIGVDGDAGKNTFAYCTSLKSIVLPDSVKTIGVACFYGCTNLETVVLGDNVSSIGISAFENSGITAFEVPDNLTVIPNGMLNNTKITTITVGDKVTTVNPGAFANCTELKNAYIGSATVKASVFDGCSNLETVIFKNVTNLDGWAFMNCTNLKTVVINAENNLTLGYNTYTTGEKANWYGNTYYSATGNVITYIASAIDGVYSEQCENCLLGDGWNDGTKDGSDILAYTNGGTFAKDTTFEAGKLATPTKAGYEFGGWYTESDFSGTAVTDATEGQIYYAKWI